MPIIPISFKQTTKDMKLYLAVSGQEEKSDFVKKCIKYYLEKNKETSSRE